MKKIELVAAVGLSLGLGLFAPPALAADTESPPPPRARSVDSDGHSEVSDRTSEAALGLSFDTAVSSRGLGLGGTALARYGTWTGGFQGGGSATFDYVSWTAAALGGVSSRTSDRTRTDLLVVAGLEGFEDVRTPNCWLFCKGETVDALLPLVGLRLGFSYAFSRSTHAASVVGLWAFANYNPIQKQAALAYESTWPHDSDPRGVRDVTIGGLSGGVALRLGLDLYRL